MLKLVAIVSALFLQSALAAPAKKHKIVEEPKVANHLTGSVDFHAVGSPGFLHIDGSGATAAGETWKAKDGTVTGHFVADLTGFKTGIGLRDKHMHEKYLESNKWKDAFFDLDSWTPTEKPSQFGGKLRIKEMSKQVFGTASWDGKTLRADFEIELDDFPIEVPRHLGITVAKTVTVEIKMAEANGS